MSMMEAEERLDRQSTRDIVEATVSLLNDGMRPHLSRWGTHYRIWCEIETEKAKADKNWIAAHDLQKIFPGYADLVADHIIANQKLMEYRRQLHRLATGVDERKP